FRAWPRGRCGRASHPSADGLGARWELRLRVTRFTRRPVVVHRESHRDAHAPRLTSPTFGATPRPILGPPQSHSVLASIRGSHRWPRASDANDVDHPWMARVSSCSWIL